jgi:hypothetical protein
MVEVVLFVVAGVIVVCIGLVAVGRETARLAGTARPAVFELEEAVVYIAARLDMPAAGRLTPDDVRWMLHTDADELEAATAKADQVELGSSVIDADATAARLLRAAERDGRTYESDDVLAVLAIFEDYLAEIKAVGPRAQLPGAKDASGSPGLEA